MSSKLMWMNKPGTEIKQCHQNVINMSSKHHQNVIKIKIEIIRIKVIIILVIEIEVFNIEVIKNLIIKLKSSKS